MVSKELMKNKDRLERIEVIREVRRKLGNLNLKDEEKALILKTLNDYEHSLTTDIARSINNIKEFETLGILHDIEIVEVPLEMDKPNYPELINLNLLDSLETRFLRLQKLLPKVSTLEILDDERRVLLESLKDYSYELQLLIQERKKNLELLEEIGTKSK